MAKSGYNFLYLVSTNVLNFRPTRGIWYHSSLTAFLEGFSTLSMGEPQGFPPSLVLRYVFLTPLLSLTSVTPIPSSVPPSFSKVHGLGKRFCFICTWYHRHPLLDACPWRSFIIEIRGQPTFYIKDRVANILGFVDSMVPVTTAQLYYRNTKPA